VYAFRHGGTHPVRTLDPSALPVATTYAGAAVSATHCKDSKTMADPSTGDPCKAFAELHGSTVGAARIVRGCGTIASRVRGAGYLKGHDCVRVALTSTHGRGSLYVWLERHNGGWRVAAAISEFHRTS
jgi:hypothetical protein